MKTKKFDLVFMAFDGATVHDSQHNTIEEANNTIKNVGSKWFFYPFPFILSGSRVVGTGCGLVRMSDKKAFQELLFKGRNINTVKKVFERTSKMEDAENLDCIDFESLMIEINRNLIRE